MASAKLLNHIESLISATITQAAPVAGGDINKAFCLETSSEKYFLKVNSKAAFPGIFKCEEVGLKTLAATKAIAVPQVILQTDVEDESCLLLEWIEPGEKTPKSQTKLGEQLALLHQSTQQYFGFQSNNYMGSLPQHNKLHGSFLNFFITQRLQPMVAMAVAKEELFVKDANLFDKLYQILPSLIPAEPPALVHGDLWGGNYLISATGRPYLIDPAVSYSCREVDIALTTLFGGFSINFYDAYQAAWPMENGWKERLPLWNLYPLLVHVNLFGGSYARQVRDVLNSFVG